MAFNTDLGTTVNVLFFLGVCARDGVPRDNIVVGVGVLEIEVDNPEVGVTAFIGVFVLDIMGTEDIEDGGEVLVIDTVFFLIAGVCVTGGGLSIVNGNNWVANAGGGSSAVTFGYLSLPGCNNFLIGILNFGLWELIIFSLICFSCASFISMLGFLLDPVFSCVLLSSFRLAFFSSSSSVYIT